ncbi:MAG TPA: hypothetical protein VM283_07625, partial [Armatimonadota bacterium]|nr:hypothetical protein [Armatimonadota bacterium]
VALATSGAGAARIPWHRSFDEALTAARAGDKPVLVFVHAGEKDRDPRHPELSQGLDPYKQMVTETLVDEGVVRAASQFECFELDLRNRANDELRDRLRVGPVQDEGLGVVTGVYPLTLFLDSNGRESFRMHGYLPPVAYALQLRRALELMQCRRAVAQNPEDAVARRNLGRSYMEMYEEAGDRFYQAAMENLELAIELDPDNQTGANYDARVDLAIFRLPDDPDKGFVDLFQLQTEDLQRKRRFEIQYYMGVAQYAAGHPGEAIEILKSFETSDRDSPYFNNEWTPLALGLLKLMRQEQAAGG